MHTHTHTHINVYISQFKFFLLFFMYQGSTKAAWIPACMQICLHFTESFFLERLTMLFRLNSFAGYIHLTVPHILDKLGYIMLFYLICKIKLLDKPITFGFVGVFFGFGVVGLVWFLYFTVSFLASHTLLSSFPY